MTPLYDRLVGRLQARERRRRGDRVLRLEFDSPPLAPHERLARPAIREAVMTRRLCPRTGLVLEET